jgi:hypothetical protein
VQEGDETVANRARLHVDLGQRRREEAAAGERLDLEVAEVAVDEPAQPLEPVRRIGRRLEHLRGEERARGLDGGELQLLLGAEVGEKTALTHPDRVGEPGDREPAKTLNCREPRCLVEDRSPAALAVAAAPAPVVPVWSVDHA